MHGAATILPLKLHVWTTAEEQALHTVTASRTWLSENVSSVWMTKVNSAPEAKQHNIGDRLQPTFPFLLFTECSLDGNSMILAGIFHIF